MNSPAFYIFLISIQFVSGSIMYSYIFARFRKANLKDVRDGNPGSTNLWRIAGWKWGLTALILDFFKGVLPLALFSWINEGLLNPYIVSLAALAGIAGHAFSPMLKLKGGKAVATTFGAWTAITKWEGPTLLGAVYVVFTIWNKMKNKTDTTPEEDALRVLLGFLALLIYVAFKIFQGQHYELLILFFGNLSIILFKHKRELMKLTHKSTKN
ncbi:MAG: glycerol-3-phosphate acyltransferase [Kosmotoga sp.]|nr:MAG: glycerol-3-phosphate acyltransferase [Kosmotoga sp.]